MDHRDDTDRSEVEGVIIDQALVEVGATFRGTLCEWYFWIVLGWIVPKCDGIWGFGGGCGCGDVIKMAVTISFLLQFRSQYLF